MKTQSNVAAALVALLSLSLGGCRHELATSRSVSRIEEQPSELELRVQSRSSDATGWRTIAMGDTLHSGDRLQLLLHLAHPAYVYVVQFVEADKANVLFPATSSSPTLQPSGIELRVPEPGFALALDQVPGEEHLYIVTSRQPLTAVDKALAAALDEVLYTPTQRTDIPQAEADNPGTGSASGSPASAGGAGAPQANAKPQATSTETTAGRTLVGEKAATHGADDARLAQVRPPRRRTETTPTTHQPVVAPASRPQRPMLLSFASRGVGLVREDQTIDWQPDDAGVGIVRFSFQHVP